MKDKLLNAYRKYFNKFKACDEVGVPVQEWNKLMEQDDEFRKMVQKIHEEKAEEIKSALILKENKTTAEIRLALELLTEGQIVDKKKAPGKHSKSQSGKEKEEWIMSRLKRVVKDE